MTQNNSISDIVKITGITIRDWVGPYYTLGCVVMISIGFCTFVDPSGTLVRSLTGLLLFATLLAWSLHVARRRKAAVASSDEEPTPIGPQLHAILFAITLFFCLGLVISEFVMHGKRGTPPPSPEVPASTTPKAPANTQNTQHTQTAPDQAPAASAAASPVPKTAPTAADQPATASSGPQPHTAETKPAAKTTEPAAPGKPKVTATPSPTSSPAPATSTRNPANAEPRPTPPIVIRETAEPQRQPPPASTSGDRQRCSAVMGKFSLGQTLSEADKQYLETSCR